MTNPKRPTIVYGEAPSQSKIAQFYQIAGESVSEPKIPIKTDDISKELVRREQIKNDDAAQDIKLKRITLDRLFIFLSVETFFIFVFALLQATRWLGFTLQEWSFNLLISATLAQITGMLFVAVRYLFPSK